MYVYLCQMSWYVFLYFVVFDFVSIGYLFSLFLTIYSMYICMLYMSPLYINMFLYFSISLFYLSYFTWLYCVCPPFLKSVFFFSWITCNFMHAYFVFQTRYLVQVYWNKFCSVLFCCDTCDRWQYILCETGWWFTLTIEFLLVRKNQYCPASCTIRTLL